MITQEQAKELKPSRVYEIRMRYRTAAGKQIEREMKARFVSLDQYGIPMFSLRPIGGMQSVPPEWIMGIPRECGPRETVCFPYRPMGTEG